MHSYQISEMVDAVATALELDADARAKAKAALASYWSDKIAIVWGVGDVQSVHKGLSEDQAINVLTDVLDDHDASLGVRWDTLANKARELYGKPEEGDDDDEED